ncbi:hypothetical protein JXA31_01425 [Candidatus Bathyarchaeota archaeon]|nr:hypothetical protein [Candidatus Bathyarchaeota archaeon]
MKLKNIVISLLAFLLLSGVLFTSVSAVVWNPSLPTDPATIKITNTTTWEFPFLILLSNVDLGFDITNGMYTGWCVDLDHYITRGVEYDVILYSSLDPLAPIPAEDWSIINYILNNKQGGTGADVQDAIWYFINGGAYYNHGHWPVSTTTEAIVADALVNGVEYEPDEGDILGIVCIPVDEPPVQIVIIELEIPGEFEGLTPGFWKNHPDLWTGYSTDDTFYDVFGVYITINAKGNDPGIYNPTLIEAIAAQGGVNEEKGVYDALARHAVAALLNAAHPEVTYPMTEQEIIDAVAEAISNADMTDAEPLKNTLDMYNNAGGGIDAHGNPI